MSSTPKWMACHAVGAFLHFSLYSAFSFSLLLLLSLLGGTPSWPCGVSALNFRCRHTSFMIGAEAARVPALIGAASAPAESVAGLLSLVQLPLPHGSGF